MFCINGNIVFFVQIGMMRKGVILAEASPLSLMQSQNCSTLEQAFLHLSQQQSQCDAPLVSYSYNLLTFFNYCCILLSVNFSFSPIIMLANFPQSVKP